MSFSLSPFSALTKPHQRIAFLVASCGFVGCIRPGSGTWGSLVTLPFALLALHFFPPYLYLITTLTLFLLGLITTHLILVNPQDDPHYVVIDEALGVFLTLAFLIPFPLHPLTLVLGFVLFRLFDALKPFPIHLIDTHWHGAIGVMMDDVLAALISGLLLLPLASFLS